MVATEQDQVLAAQGLRYVYARLEDAPYPPASMALAQITHTPGSFGTVSARELTTFLAARLDTHHVPEAVVILDEFPRTVSGKMDRTRLASQLSEPAPGPSPGTDDPVDPVAAGIEAVWQEVLGKPVMSQDDFFGLGGSSLSAARVTARVRQRFGAPGISIRMIFEDSRLDQYTTAIRSHLRATQPGPASDRWSSHETLQPRIRLSC